MNDFILFCRQATDAQLENILKLEWEASHRNLERLVDYNDAENEAIRRGWNVLKGKRL